MCDGPEGKALWSSLVKNKDGTVDFKEFIRVFASRPNTANGVFVTMIMIIVDLSLSLPLYVPFFPWLSSSL